MEEFLHSNVGLRSRFPNIIEFPDYSAEELVLISRQFLTTKGFQISADVERKLHTIFTDGTEVNHAGNGRYARNICEAAIRAHALRVSQVNHPSVEQLTTIESADFQEGEQ